MNFCSCIVHTHRGAGHEVMPRLKAMPGVEVHAGAEADKLIVTIEDTEQAVGADTVGALTRVPGVINAVLI